MSSVRLQTAMSWTFSGDLGFDSVLSPVAFLCPHATPSVVLVEKPNRLRNTLYVVVARLFFLAMSVSQPDALHDYPNIIRKVRDCLGHATAQS